MRGREKEGRGCKRQAEGGLARLLSGIELKKLHGNDFSYEFKCNSVSFLVRIEFNFFVKFCFAKGKKRKRR